ncbi:MAG: amino terminal protease self-immunity [Chthoniobacteraceae bacterium]|nr:amino terminal protease self-immunity [Chthoniobacteraceae bacterium]
MKDLAKILTYFIAVIVLGALIAPPLYWGGHAVAARGVLSFLGETEFQKYFNRAVLIAALALLWPAIRSLKIRGVRELGLEPDPRWVRHFLIGFLIAAVAVGVMAAGYIQFEVYHWKKPALPWGSLPKIAFGALVVAALEEALFRGAIFGLFRRTLRPYPALFLVTALFAILHFLKPDEDLQMGEIGWLSGFEILPHTFHQFAEPAALLAGFSTLFVLGWLLGYATLRTRALWMSIGLHAGVVFVKMGFSKFTKRDLEALPWIGRELQIGLVPVAVLCLAGVVLWLGLRETQSASKRAGQTDSGE